MTRAVWCIAEAAHRVPGISGRLMRKEMRQFCRMPLIPPTQLADRSSTNCVGGIGRAESSVISFQ